MKHILFYTDTPNIGGAEKHMLLLAKHLRGKARVSLAYGRYSKLSQMHNEFSQVCENVFVLNVSHKHDPRHYSELKRIISEQEFDLIHLHLWNPGSCRYAFYASSASDLPIVTTEHDPFELTGVKRLIKHACLTKTERTITVSRDNYRLLGEYYDVSDKRLELVHNGIEIDSFLDNHTKAELPVKNGDIVITCVAELHPRKGHRYLLEAFRKLQTVMPSLQLILVGTGPAELELKTTAQSMPNVHFLGWREDIPQILRASDLFVLPSLREAFGLSVVEAMASGAVVIATDNGGTADIIQSGVTGYLVPPASADAIADKIVVALKNPAQKLDIQKAALESVQRNFTAQKMAEATLAVYQKVC